MAGFSPYSPAATLAAVELSEPWAVSALAAETVQLAPANPNRLYLLIMNRSGGMGFVARPVPIQGSGGISPDVGQSYILIHNATFPGLVQGEWWFFYPGGGDVDVIEAIVKC